MILLLLAIISLNIQSNYGSCVLKIEDKFTAPIFWESFNGNNVVITPKDNAFNIRDGSTINAFCHNNFSTSSNNKAITCTDGKLVGAGDLKCYGGQGNFYIANSKYCRNLKQYGYGIVIESNVIVLSHFCYDLNKMETKLVTYETGNNLLVLKGNSAGEVQLQAQNAVKLDFFESKQLRTKDIDSYTKQMYQQKGLYKYESLIDLDILTKGFHFGSNQIESITSIPWLKSLKDGNWKIFENNLKKLAQGKKFTILVGILNAEDVKIEFDNLKFKTKSGVKNIPLFVYCLFKEKNNPRDMGTVVVGVNYPFVETKRYASLEFCRDGNINQGMEKIYTKRGPSLGYIFFCSRESFYKNLNTTSYNLI